MNHRQQQSPFAPPTRAAAAAAAPSVCFSTKPPTTPTTTTTTTANNNNNTKTNNNSANKPECISKNDVNIPMPGDDGTSSLSWNPPNNNNNNLLVSSNWDYGVRLWKVEKNQQQQQQQQQLGGVAMMVQAIPQAMVHHENSVFDTCFSPDGSLVFSVGGDRAVRMWDLGAALLPPASSSSNNKNIAPQIGAHDAPIRSVRFLKVHGGLVVSGGWDSKVKFWDARSNKPAAVLTLSERVHAMDVQDNLLVVATADQKIVAYDCSSNEPRPLAAKNPLKNDQVRSLACFPDATGYAIGGIAGRVALEYLQDVPQAASLLPFTFMGHRDKVSSSQHRRPAVISAHAVNSITFYDTHKLATTGSDGKIVFWDKQSRKKLQTFDAIQRPIPCAKFNADSSILAYASTDDWSKGCMHAQPGNQVFLHSMTL